MNIVKALLLPVAMCVSIGARAGDFSKHFADSTLRLDYVFGGTLARGGCTILFDGGVRTPGWAGRRNHLDSVPLRGNATLSLRDPFTGETIYATSFSTLFQEWLTTSEAHVRPRAFENSILVPLPRHKTLVEVVLYGNTGDTLARIGHEVDPGDILLADKGRVEPNPHRYIHRGGDPRDVIDVAILAEGYMATESEKFYSDATVAVEAILAHEPFSSRAEDFNFVAVGVPSLDSGVSVPRLGAWRSTAVGSNFSTFYSDRYLTTSNVKRIHDSLVNIPYEHVVILANTPEYGGGGIYNFYTLTTAGHASFRPVVVHEFGHSFAGLADEYFYEDDDTTTDMYSPTVEPWEQNLTTLTDFNSKWFDMIPQSVPVPTPVSDGAMHPVGVYEGGGYRAKGIYRPSYDCRMRTNTAEAFCPVCARAIGRIIDFYTK